jgi:hypothetical protein
MADRVSDEDLDLLDELGVDTAPAPSGGRSPKEQRIIAGFEEINRFVEEHGRPPANNPTAEIFERIYAVRLESIRQSLECRNVLSEMDTHGLLAVDWGSTIVQESEPSDDARLLAELEVEENAVDQDLTLLTHVRTREEIRAAEEIAKRDRCMDFEQFKPIFAEVQRDLQSGSRKTLKFQENADVNQGEIFILDGQKVYVASVGEKFISDYGRPDSRLRLIYDNGTESDLLMRSFQRALYKDKTSRRITSLEHGPLFSEKLDDEDALTGHIYVLRSLSDHPFIKENREVIHKIGVTGGDVKRRIANAKKDPTFLLAEVEIVETYRLANLDRSLLERLLHRFLAPARLDVELKDRFGAGVEPQEWFIAPLPIICETIKKLMDGSLQKYRYDPETARIVQLDS